MAGYNLKSQAKRKRELAKKDKRDAKDQKRAERKAERNAPGVGVPLLPNQPPLVTPPPVRSPLAAAVAAWKRPPVAAVPHRRDAIRRAQVKSG